MILRKYKAPRHNPHRDIVYLAWLRTMPCVVCWTYRIRSLRFATVEAAHVGERGIGQKCSDREALPLCTHHHRTGPQSHHVLGRKFWEFWHLDRFLLIRNHNECFEKWTQNPYEKEKIIDTNHI